MQRSSFTARTITGAASRRRMNAKSAWRKTGMDAQAIAFCDLSFNFRDLQKWSHNEQ